MMKVIFCPQCGTGSPAMLEPYRYVCMRCRTIWEIHDVIEEAMEKAQAQDTIPQYPAPAELPQEGGGQ